MEFSFKDAYRAMIEFQSNGRNTVLYDDYGNPNIMYVIPKTYMNAFNLGQVEPGTSDEIHRAFVFHGKEVDEIFIGKYEASYMGTIGGVPVSQFGVSPADNLPYKKMLLDSFKKGRGWHMMQNLEFAILQHQMQTTGVYPAGNKSAGHDYFDPKLFGKLDPMSPYDANGIGEKAQLILTGTGPKEFYHDHTFSGISDLVGNTWCLCGGCKLVRGEIWVAGEDENQLMNNWDVDDSECGVDDMTGYIRSMAWIDENYQFASTATPGPAVHDNNTTPAHVFEGSCNSSKNPCSAAVMRGLAMNGLLRFDDEKSQHFWVSRAGVHHISRGDRTGSKQTDQINHIHFSLDESIGYNYSGFRVCYMNV